MLTTATGNDVLPDSEVNKEAIRAIFDAALYRTNIDEDDDVVIHGAGMRTFIQVYPGNRIRLLSVFRAEEEVTEEGLHAAANAFNLRLAIVKASAQRYQDDKLRVIFETDLSYDGGLVPMNLVMRFRKFEDIIRRQHELSDLLA